MSIDETITDGGLLDGDIESLFSDLDISISEDDNYEDDNYEVESPKLNLPSNEVSGGLIEGDVINPDEEDVIDRGMVAIHEQRKLRDLIKTTSEDLTEVTLDAFNRNMEVVNKIREDILDGNTNPQNVKSFAEVMNVVNNSVKIIDEIFKMKNKVLEAEIFDTGAGYEEGPETQVNNEPLLMSGSDSIDSLFFDDMTDEELQQKLDDLDPNLIVVEDK